MSSVSDACPGNTGFAPFLCCPRNGKRVRARQKQAGNHPGQATVSFCSWEGDAPDPASPETGLND